MSDPFSSLRSQRYDFHPIPSRHTQLSQACQCVPVVGGGVSGRVPDVQHQQEGAQQVTEGGPLHGQLQQQGERQVTVRGRNAAHLTAGGKTQVRRSGYSPGCGKNAGTSVMNTSFL